MSILYTKRRENARFNGVTEKLQGENISKMNLFIKLYLKDGFSQ